MPELTVAHFFAPPREQISVTLPVEIVALLDQIAEEHHTTRSAVVAAMVAKSPRLACWRAEARASRFSEPFVNWLLGAR